MTVTHRFDVPNLDAETLPIVIWAGGPVSVIVSPKTDQVVVSSEAAIKPPAIEEISGEMKLRVGNMFSAFSGGPATPAITVLIPESKAARVTVAVMAQGSGDVELLGTSRTPLHLGSPLIINLNVRASNVFFGEYTDAKFLNTNNPKMVVELSGVSAHPDASVGVEFATMKSVTIAANRETNLLVIRLSADDETPLSVTGTSYGYQNGAGTPTIPMAAVRATTLPER